MAPLTQMSDARKVRRGQRSSEGRSGIGERRPLGVFRFLVRLTCAKVESRRGGARAGCCAPCHALRPSSLALRLVPCIQVNSSVERGKIHHD